jgi:hypothetical protein
MHESAKRDASKPRQVKLRASCDTCFLAKVKCSKARPVCSRCLACGAECKYSPSSRAGKPKSGQCKAEQHCMIEGKIVRDASNALSSSQTAETNVAEWGIGMSRECPPQWSTPRTMLASPEAEVKHRRAASVTLRPAAEDILPEAEGSSVNEDCFSPFFGWVSPADTNVTSPYFDHHIQPRENVPPISSSHQLSPSWLDQKDSSPFPSPPPEVNSTPIIYSPNSRRKVSTCSCFNRCLETLQKLHSYEDLGPSTSFDVILNVNQDAVATCSTLLGCSRCTTKPVSELHVMILGTITSKIMSICQKSWKEYFENSRGEMEQQLPLHLGNYRITGEDIRWLEMRIMMRDLKVLEEIFPRFQELLVRSEGEAGISYDWANHLHQSLLLSLGELKEYRNFLSVEE